MLAGKVVFEVLAPSIVDKYYNICSQVKKCRKLVWEV